MKEIKISKRNGKFRTVVVPSAAQKRNQRELNPELQAKAIFMDKHGVQHGFTPCRSPVTNAKQHIGYEWTITFDIADCFDHVSWSKVSGALGTCNTGPCFHNDIARQGLPTSPALANIALVGLDKKICAMLYYGEAYQIGVYTRYADDLTISTNNKGVVADSLHRVPVMAQQEGFSINPAKTEVQWSKRGRRIVTGVAVDDKGIYPTRKLKRRLRAARHQNNHNEAMGLEEWSKLKEPDVMRWARGNVISSDLLTYLVMQRDS